MRIKKKSPHDRLACELCRRSGDPGQHYFPSWAVERQKSEFSKACLTCLEWAESLDAVTCSTVRGGPGTTAVCRLLLFASLSEGSSLETGHRPEPKHPASQFAGWVQLEAHRHPRRGNNQPLRERTSSAQVTTSLPSVFQTTALECISLISQDFPLNFPPQSLTSVLSLFLTQIPLSPPPHLHPMATSLIPKPNFCVTCHFPCAVSVCVCL